MKPINSLLLRNPPSYLPSLMRRLTPYVLSILALAPLAPSMADVVINEIHYSPSPNNEAVEYIELHNTGPESVDLSGWKFTDGFAYIFPEDSALASGAYLILAQNEAEYNRKFGSIFVGGIKASGQFESGLLSDSGEEITLRDATDAIIDRVNYGDGFPWPVTAGGDGPSMELIHPSMDNDLGGSWRSSTKPTPGEENSIFSDTAPPQIRQVNHAPKAPLPGEAVTVSAKVTDPQTVKAVTLRYQQVEPGKYIQIDDEEFQNGWTELAMEDDGQETDTYTVTLPGDLQEHRHLMRYQITVEDGEGAAITVPYADDGQPNFAYFCYGDMPAWTGAIEPGETEEVTYGPELLQSVPVYQLITSKDNHVDSQNIIGSSGGGYTGDDYRWKGTLVYDGDVYDHISFRARGGVWRYAMGKNMWKFLFNRSHEFQARDQLGKKYPTKWKRLNFSAMIQQGNFNHRGEQGLFESVGFELFRKAGIEAPFTHHLHFRIIENAKETNLFGNQYGLDFQGLYLAIEQLDSRFMRAHGLPEGNLYKMENGTGIKQTNGELKTLAPFPAKNDSSDLVAFKNDGYEDNPGPEWYRENLDLPRYYAYRSIVESIHHYDIGNGKNYYYYHNPETEKWSTLPWDLDLTWDDSMYGPGTEPFQRRVSESEPFEIEYQNKLREVLGLLYNEEQTGLIIREKASAVYTPGVPSLVDADRAMWDYNPIMTSNKVNPSKSGEGRFYRIADTDDFPGMMNRMVDYVNDRSEWMEDRVLNSTEGITPKASSVTYVGDAEFPVDGLRFQSSKFAGGSIFAPQTFAAMKWRLAEITDVNAEGFTPTPPNRYEIDAVWESDILTEFNADITIPPEVVRPGRVYRVRVRTKNERGLWSYWSDPVQFIAGQPDIQPFLDNLIISEVLYAPAEATTEERAAGFITADFEFIELLNLGTEALDLTDVRFTKGVDHDFGEVSIAGGARALLVRNQAAFESRYGQDHTILGEYGADGGSKLDNNGERLKLSFGAGVAIRDLTYDLGNGWPDLEKGTSLVLLDDQALSDHASSASWGISSTAGGTPGAGDGGVIVNPGPTNGYANWQEARFTEAELADENIAGPLADPDGNGLVNLQDYALAGQAITISTDNHLVVRRPSGVTDVTYVLESSNDLTGWATSPFTPTIEAGDSGQEIATYALDPQAGTYWRIVTTLK